MIPEFTQKSREGSKPKPNQNEYNDSFQYGTDNKKYLNQSGNSIEEI